MLNNVAIFYGAVSPAVHDHKDTFFIFHGVNLLDFNLSTFVLSVLVMLICIL
jgi:hypothetical protein